MDNLKQKLIGLLVGFEVALFGCVYFMVLGTTLKPEEGKTKNLILGIIALIIIIAIIGFAFYLTKHILLPNKFKAPSEGGNDFLAAFKGIKNDNSKDDNKRQAPLTRTRTASEQVGGQRPSSNQNRQRPVQSGSNGTRNGNVPQGDGRVAPAGRPATSRQRPTTTGETGRPATSRQRPAATGETGRPIPTTRPRPNESGRPTTSKPRPTTTGESRRPSPAGRPTTPARPRPSEGARRPRPTNNQPGGRPRV